MTQEEESRRKRQLLFPLIGGRHEKEAEERIVNEKRRERKRSSAKSSVFPFAMFFFSSSFVVKKERFWLVYDMRLAGIMSFLCLSWSFLLSQACSVYIFFTTACTHKFSYIFLWWSKKIGSMLQQEFFLTNVFLRWQDKYFISYLRTNFFFLVEKYVYFERGEMKRFLGPWCIYYEIKGEMVFFLFHNNNKGQRDEMIGAMMMTVIWRDTKDHTPPPPPSEKIVSYIFFSPFALFFVLSEWLGEWKGLFFFSFVLINCSIFS